MVGEGVTGLAMWAGRRPGARLSLRPAISKLAMFYPMLEVRDLRHRGHQRKALWAYRLLKTSLTAKHLDFAPFKTKLVCTHVALTKALY